MKAGGCLALLLASAVAMPQARPRPGLPPALRRALAASATLRYTGRRLVSVLTDGQLDQHEEIVMRDGAQTRIEFPAAGAFRGQVIVEGAKERRHYLPEENEVRVLPPRREEGLQRLRALARSGAVAVEPGERIAGFPTVGILVRDAAGNPLQRLAIEPKTGMVLRRRLYNATGTEIGGFVYTKVDLNPRAFDPSLFRIERKGAQTTTPWDTLRRLARREGFAPVGLAESTGFRLDEARVRRLPEGNVLVQNYVGPGGRLALFQFRAAVSPERLRRQGRNVLHNVSWTTDGTTYVLLGPQDEATLARLKGAVGTGP